MKFRSILGLLFFGLIMFMSFDTASTQATDVANQEKVYASPGHDGTPVFVQNDETVDESPTFWQVIRENLGTVILGLLGFIEIIVRLTPTERDDSWFTWLKRIIDAIFPPAIKSKT